MAGRKIDLINLIATRHGASSAGHGIAPIAQVVESGRSLIFLAKDEAVDGKAPRPYQKKKQREAEVQGGRLV